MLKLPKDFKNLKKFEEYLGNLFLLQVFLLNIKLLMKWGMLCLKLKSFRGFSLE